MAIKVRYEWRQLDVRWNEDYTKQETLLVTPDREVGLDVNEFSEKAEALDALAEALSKYYNQNDFVLLEIYDRA